MSSGFLERFKNKCSVVGKEGEIAGFGFVAKKPPRPSNLRNAGANILDSKPTYSRPTSLQEPRRPPLPRAHSASDAKSVTSESSIPSSRASTRSSNVPSYPNSKPVSAGYGYMYARSRSKSLLNES